MFVDDCLNRVNDKNLTITFMNDQGFFILREVSFEKKVFKQTSSDLLIESLTTKVIDRNAVRFGDESRDRDFYLSHMNHRVVRKMASIAKNRVEVKKKKA